MATKTDVLSSCVSAEQITHSILVIRGHKILLDINLAELYGVETKVLKRAVRRNQERFPEDFMFQLTKQELNNLRCQFGTSSWGGARYTPMAFTEHGAIMAASVLNSPGQSMQVLKSSALLFNYVKFWQRIKIWLSSLSNWKKSSPNMMNSSQSFLI